MSIKLEQGKKLIVSGNNPKVVGKGFTVGNPYVITSVAKAPHGEQKIPTEYATFTNDTGTPVSFWQEVIDNAFALEGENLKTKVMDPPLPPPPPNTLSTPEVNPEKIRELTSGMLKLSEENANLKMQISQQGSEIGSLQFALSEKDKELQFLRDNPVKAAQAFPPSDVLGTMVAIIGTGVMKNKAVITMVAVENLNTVSAKIDDFPTLSESGNKPILELDIELGKTITQAYSENGIRIQTIQSFTDQLKDMEKELAKKVKKASAPEEKEKKDEKKKKTDLPATPAPAPSLPEESFMAGAATPPDEEEAPSPKLPDDEPPSDGVAQRIEGLKDEKF